MPGFLDALASLGTSRRKVRSRERFAASPSMSLVPLAPLLPPVKIRVIRVIRGSGARKMPFVSFVAFCKQQTGSLRGHISVQEKCRSRNRGTGILSRCAAKTELCVTCRIRLKPFGLWTTPKDFGVL